MRASAKIEEAIKRRGKRGPTASGEYMVCCPWCIETAGKEDIKFKLAVKPAEGLYYCYRCETGGRTDLSWLGEAEQDEAVLLPMVENLGPPEGFEALDFSASVHKPYLNYLLSRQVLDAAIRSRAGVCRTGKYAGRVILPHLEWSSVDGFEWKGFVARSINPRERLRYLYPRGMDRKRGLWKPVSLTPPLEAHAPWERAEVFIVEGVFDALPLWPYGVATFGKAVTDEQIDALIALNRPLVVCLDGDAWEEAQCLCVRFWLRDKTDVKWCKLPPATDPGQLGWDVRNYIQGP